MEMTMTAQWPETPVSHQALYVLQLALFNPDVSWDRKNNPEPWNKLGANDQYNFYSVIVDYSKLKKEGPAFYMKCFPIKPLRIKAFQKPPAHY
ncbi:cytochrome c oxidase subunit NDUFA4-like [Elephas maximus indicus]|uniref:cytochrome c oxidase subunit NDUFA4-like n=1 Tax=Elephas maximus indicus TaxID=99487 RepID=UPI002115F012|nr:cytochrome c oxidase subunit NDUFA4-like [Elephas maximus indicus]